MGKSNRKSIEVNPFTPEEVHTLISGSLDAIIDNNEYFYTSSVGVQYSHLTMAGEQMLVKSLSALLPLLAQAHERELDERAKSITWNTLQEDTNDR
jgi:hypothetical protein